MRTSQVALALLVASVPTPLFAATPRTVTISVYNFGYTPQTIRLAAGQPVTLRFVNTANGGHDFTAKSFFGASKILSGSAAEGEVELRAHETKAVTLVPSAGTYHVHCSHFMHKTFGMKGEIVVN